MPTVKTHPLMEIIAKKLFAIETVPPEEQRKMVRRACKAAADYHDTAIAETEAKYAELKEAVEAALKIRDLWLPDQGVFFSEEHFGEAQALAQMYQGLKVALEKLEGK